MKRFNLLLSFLMGVFAVAIVIFTYSMSIAQAIPSQTYENPLTSSENRCDEPDSDLPKDSLKYKEQQIRMTTPEYYEIQYEGFTALTFEGNVTETHVSNADAPWTHMSHDLNWIVKLDPRFEVYHSTGNERLDDKPARPNPVLLQNGKVLPADKKNEKVMEMENEIGFVNDGTDKRFPKEFWPSAGDRVWMIGRYIFDCGHIESGPHTELHPVEAAAFTHFEPLVISKAGPKPILAAKTS